ncbi:hypothetical protein [Gordonia tangerina]|uniref:Uncharacterized protein n=1 Tax=Gordonia tangerina TaxID=2911060 RepID=A0ABS9DMT7_9ACTN|nr:hypothetical protein [Gordonia tangerina]MCF3939907.1 hypothetical protein [Gordonia tangerina]
MSWLATQPTPGADVHVLPVDDLTAHDENDTCTCGPTTEPVERPDGSIGWVITHHSLDGREHHEHA